MNISDIIQKRRWAILLIIITCVLLYGKTISYDYSLDDHLINTNIPDKRDGIKGLTSIFETRFNKSDYRPILILSYALEKYTLEEQNPHVSHAINLLLYILLCISIYYFLLLLPLGQESKFIALMITLLFVTHPIHTNVVCNLKSRDNLLSMLFGILTTIQVVKIISKEKNLQIHRYLLAALFFAMGILSKVDVLGFAFFIPLILLLFFNPKKIILPGIIIITFLLLQSLFYKVIPDKIAPADINLAVKVTFTENPIASDFTFINKTGAASMTGFYYLKFLIVPYGYWYYFGFDQVKLFPITSFPAIASLILLVAIFIAGIWHLKKDKLLSFGIFSTFLFLIYCFNFILPVSGIIADRYAFMASLGFCIAVVALINRFTKNKTNISWKICLFICLVWSVFSFARTSVWKDGKTLIENDTPNLERSYEGQRIAAMTYVELYEKNNEKELLENALFHIKKANAIYPKNTVCQIFEGLIYYKKGQLNEADKLYQLALKNDSTSSEALELIGDLKYEQKDLTAARKAYDALWKLNFGNNAVVNKISTVIYESENKDSVLNYNNALMKTDTALFAPYENLGYLFLLQQDTMKAKSYFEAAVKKGMDPLGVPSSIQ